jgi:SAM-dependent methyltransferase
MKLSGISKFARRKKTALVGKLLGHELLGFKRFHPLFAGKIGLEIGGPSDVFGAGGLLPIYRHALRVDGVNFATHTVWEGEIADGFNYRYAEGKLGRQYISESTNLAKIGDRTYDFVASSHSLEHSANALKALCEWKRVIAPGGTLLVVLPDHRRTFDHRRPVTTYRHLLDDLERDVGEDDLTHFDEIMALHDLSRDPMAGDKEAFRARSLKNVENRCFHQHVFDQALVRQIFRHLDIELLYERVADPVHVIALGRVR